MIMLRSLRLLAVAAAVALLAWPAFAQQSPPAKNPFGVGPPAAERPLAAPRPGPEATPTGPMQRMWLWVLQKQGELHRELAAAVRRLKTADPFNAALFLAAISFAYGVLHAVSIGHGKAVITSYMLSNGQTVRRGILLSFMAALFQAFSALVFVAILSVLLGFTGLQRRAMEAWLETASWGLVALVGVWLLYYQLRTAFAPAYAHAHAGGHHGHDHHHHHDHHDASCEVCAHVPAASELQGDWSWRRAFALAFAIGIRPCTGAILVLGFAIGQGLWWAGVLSTLAMAVGTAITVSVLAASAVGFRELAARVAGSRSSKWADRVQLVAGLGAATLVLVLGASFFVLSLSGVQQPL